MDGDQAPTLFPSVLGPVGGHMGNSRWSLFLEVSWPRGSLIGANGRPGGWQGCDLEPEAPSALRALCDG